MKNPGKLDEVVLRAPRMPVAGADGEAEPPIESGGRVEIAHGMNDMVETARHSSNHVIAIIRESG